MSAADGIGSSSESSLDDAFLPDVKADEAAACSTVAKANEVFTSSAPPTPEQAAQLANGLSVAGRELEPPRFHDLCGKWRVRQRFSAKQDPDRTREPWQTPSFARGDAEAQRTKTSVEELPMPQGSFARVVSGVLDEEHCAALIGLCNEKGFTPALVNMGGGDQQLMPDHRDGFRVIADDPPLTAYLFEVLRPYIPEHWKRATAMELNGRCRFLCYTPGQEFGEHCDGRYRDPSGKYSQVTVQLYLHDVPQENGGATTFIFPNGSRLPCQPRAGSVLLFSQDLAHEGSLLKSGLKYTFRTEVMYSVQSRLNI